LTPATGARTTRFCRTQLRRSSGARRSLTGNPPCDPHRAPGAFASTAALPNVRDDRDTPLLRAGMSGVLGLIWVSREGDSFFAQGWTRQISLKGLRNFLFSRSARRVSDSVTHQFCREQLGGLRCRQSALWAAARTRNFGAKMKACSSALQRTARDREKAEPRHERDVCLVACNRRDQC